MPKEARNKLLQATVEQKTHFKLYKVGRSWAIAGLTVFFSGVMLTQKPQVTKADTQTATPVANTTDVQVGTVSNKQVLTPSTVATIADQTIATDAVPTVTMATGENAPATWTRDDFTFTRATTNTYNVTFSAAGIAKLAAANPEQTIDAAHVTGGVVTQTASDSQANSAASTTSTTSEAQASGPSTAESSTPSLTGTSVASVASEGSSATDSTPTSAATTTTTPASTTSTASTTATSKTAVSAATAPASNTANVTLSTDTIGYGSGLATKNSDVPLTLNLHLTVTAGDTISFTLPTDSPIIQYTQTDPLPTGVGSTVVKGNLDGTTTVTETFTANSQIDQDITLKILGNSSVKSIPSTAIGTQIKEVTWTLNGEVQTPLTITQTINPTVNITTPKRTKPTTDTVTTGADDTYTFSLGESTGAADDTTGKRILKALNVGGATVTIPVPTGFLLNESTTADINLLDKGMTITQPDGVGGAILIQAPANTGTSSADTLAYTLYGQFVDGTSGTVSADAPITLVLKDETGKETTYTGGVWTETVDPTATQPSKIAMADLGNESAATTQLVLDDDPTNDPASLSRMVFSLDSQTDITNGKFTISIPDGVDATSITVPAEGVAGKHYYEPVPGTYANTEGWYLPGTTSYDYQLTLADGTVETGTVAAGGTIEKTGDAAIRSAVLMPNFLAAGAYLSYPYDFAVHGSVAINYDDGTPVSQGDKLTFTYAFNDGGTESTIVTKDQTVVQPTGRVQSYSHQYGTNPGDTGVLSITQNGNSGQTTDKLYEPILYFVVPSNATITSVKYPTDTHPTVSTYTTADGRTGVKIDYTGTG